MKSSHGPDRQNILEMPMTLCASPAAAEPRPIGAYVAFAAICVVWGTTFLAIRIAIETIPTLLVTSIRFVGAGLMLLLIARLSGARFPQGRRDWITQMTCGVLMVAIGNTSVVWSENYLSSGMAALMAATIPLWMALMEAVIGEARLTWRKSAGLALGFGGVALLVAPAIGRPDVSLKFFAAVGMMQVSSIAWNSGTLNSKRRPSSGSPTALASVQMLTGGSVIGVLALITGSYHGVHMSVRSLSAVLYLMVLGSVVAYSAYLYALRRLSAGRLSSYAYVNPAIAVLVGAAVLSEPLTLRIVMAMAVILSGVAVIQMEKRVVNIKELK